MMMMTLHEVKVWRTSLFPDAAPTQIVWKLRPPNRGLLIFPRGQHLVSAQHLVSSEIYLRNILSEKKYIVQTEKYIARPTINISQRAPPYILQHLQKEKCNDRQVGIIDVSQIGYHLKIWCLVTSALILLIEMKNVTAAKWGVIDVSQRGQSDQREKKIPTVFS